MWLFQDFLDQSKQLNQTPSWSLPAYHPPNKKYKIIHQALTIPNLPAPLHYLNFLSETGTISPISFRFFSCDFFSCHFNARQSTYSQ